MKFHQIGMIGLSGTIILVLFFLKSCTHEPLDIETFDPVCFNTQVFPIIQTSCGMTGCHDGTEEGFLATNYQSISKAVKSGDPRGSILYSVITDIHGENMMPPDRPLTQLQRNIIEVWILQGANETICISDTSNGGNNSADQICFVQDILPVMLSTCGTTGCHDAITHEEGYILTDYNSIKSEGITPFFPERSEIYKVITETGEDRMPPFPKEALTATQVAAIKKWIEDGAQNSDCPDNACDSTGTISYSAQVDPVFQLNCAGCHNSSLANGGIDLSSYDQVNNAAQTLRNNTSVISGSIKRLNGFKPMPPTFSLDDCDIKKIELWIAQGGNNN